MTEKKRHPHKCAPRLNGSKAPNKPNLSVDVEVGMHPSSFGYVVVPRHIGWPSWTQTIPHDPEWRHGSPTKTNLPAGVGTWVLGLWWFCMSYWYLLACHGLGEDFRFISCGPGLEGTRPNRELWVFGIHWWDEGRTDSFLVRFTCRCAWLSYRLLRMRCRSGLLSIYIWMLVADIDSYQEWDQKK